MDNGYFSLFNLEPRFALSVPELDSAFRSLARRVHPDQFAHTDDALRRESLLRATQVNEAYRTLRRPLLRARHLLELRGTATGERGDAPSPHFLLEYMELREAVEDAKGARSGSALQSLDTTVRTRIARLQDRLRLHLDERRDDLAAAATVHELMFIEKVAGEIADARAALGE